MNNSRRFWESVGNESHLSLDGLIQLRCYPIVIVDCENIYQGAGAGGGSGKRVIHWKAEVIGRRTVEIAEFFPSLDLAQQAVEEYAIAWHKGLAVFFDSQN